MSLPNVDHLDESTQKQLAALALNLANNPKTRKGFLQGIKETNPGVPIPELDTEEQIDSKLAAAQKETKELKEAFENYKLENQMTVKRNLVMKEHNLGEQDLSKMEEMMVKKELPADYEWAAKLYKNQTEIATPTFETGVGPLDLPNHDGIMDDEQRWSLKTAHSMIDEMRRKGSMTNF